MIIVSVLLIFGAAIYLGIGFLFAYLTGTMPYEEEFGFFLLLWPILLAVIPVLLVMSFIELFLEE